MVRFILVALSVILFLIFSIPILIVEWLLGRSNPDKKNRQSLAIVQFMFRYLLWLAGVKVTVRGQENIPADTAVLYVGNHRSYFDILVGYTTVPGLTGFVAKKEMERYLPPAGLDEKCELPVLGPQGHQGGLKDHPGGDREGEGGNFHLDLPGGAPETATRASCGHAGV